ncbi:MAG: hypothetical protein HZA89_09840 [Verrucomicrobia bacterium]|nr:hypothetical protein [Verrucomicrobiota bacterium]
MKIKLSPKVRQRGGAMIAYFILAMIVASSVAAVATFVAQGAYQTKRRAAMVDARMLAESGVDIGARNLETSFTNSSGTWVTRMGSNGYAAGTSITLGSVTYSVYQRTVSSPFTNKTGTIQVLVTNTSSPSFARIQAYSTVMNGVPQTNTGYMEMIYGLGAAIVDVDAGNFANATADKANAQTHGNVTITSPAGKPTIIDGGILANGRVNMDADTTGIPASSLSQSNYGTAMQVPDYTNPGSPDQLFDFTRFRVAADAMGTHYTNFAAFSNVVKAAQVTNGFLEGIIYVDMRKTSPLPDTKKSSGWTNTIRIKGTLVLNFTNSWTATDKFFNEADMEINPANWNSPFNLTNPATYAAASGYPPTINNAAKRATNATVSAALTAAGFAPFTATDDLPAIMYNIGVFDIHGSANVCGVIYSPNYMEIENKNPAGRAGGSTQYFSGSIITGGGVFLDNGDVKNRTVVSFDPLALDKLATQGNKGKVIKLVYRQ